jgi:hypothetical protein
MLEVVSSGTINSVHVTHSTAIERCALCPLSLFLGIGPCFGFIAIFGAVVFGNLSLYVQLSVENKETAREKGED